MTREERITALANLRYVKSWKDKERLADETIDTCIKALEQEPIIDEIMAEINTPNRGSCDYYIVDRIEEIIDKYRGEDKE